VPFINLKSSLDSQLGEVSGNGDNSVNNSYNTNTSSSICYASTSSNPAEIGNHTSNKQDKQSEIFD
jgi:hypothetical protein